MKNILKMKKEINEHFFYFMGHDTRGKDGSATTVTVTVSVYFDDSSCRLMSKISSNTPI